MALSPTLLWRGSAGATSYTVEVSGDESFSNIVYNNAVNITMVTVTPSLAEDTVYWWRVKANNENGSSDWSSVRSFKTKQTAPSELSLYNSFIFRAPFFMSPGSFTRCMHNLII